MSVIHTSVCTSLQVGLAVAGGGISGAASVGVLQAFLEAGIEVTHIAGTSSGAIVAALFALGYDPFELHTLVPSLTKKQLDYDRVGIALRILGIRRFLEGLIKGKKLHGEFLRLTEGRTLNEVSLPVGIVATDLKSGNPLVFTQTPLPTFATITQVQIADALSASCAIPLLFRPVRLQNKILVDGGVVMNCPVRVVREMGAPFVIAVDTVTAFANEKIENLTSGFSIFSHVINLTLRNQMEVEQREADLVFFPHVGAVGALDFEKLQVCIEAGYAYAKERIPKLIETLQAKLPTIAT